MIAFGLKIKRNVSDIWYDLKAKGQGQTCIKSDCNALQHFVSYYYIFDSENSYLTQCLSSCVDNKKSLFS